MLGNGSGSLGRHIRSGRTFSRSGHLMVMGATYFFMFCGSVVWLRGLYVKAKNDPVTGKSLVQYFENARCKLLEIDRAVLPAKKKSP